MKTHALAAMLVVIGAGCGSDGRSSVDVTFHTQSSPPTSTTPTGSSTIPATTISATSPAPAATNPPGPPSVSLTQLGAFDQPVGFAWRPTDTTSYVVEQAGRVVIMKDGQPGPTALDMTNLTKAGGEQGLLGLAINADGTLAYVDYTDTDGNTAIDEYAIGGDGTFDVASRRKVLAFDQPYPNHNGGELVFGPDHLLYIGTGDGGSAGDPDRRALNLGQWLGKILRIDPRQG